MSRPIITPANAYRYNDNYTVESVDEPIKVLGVEHNRTEAEAIAKWMTDDTGSLYVARYNSPDIVRQAKAFKPEPLRYKFREDALKEMGIL